MYIMEAYFVSSDAATFVTSICILLNTFDFCKSAAEQYHNVLITHMFI